MGVITLKIDDGIEDRLRKKVGRERGAARGAISSSVEEALEAWLGEDNRRTAMGNQMHHNERFYVAKKKDEILAQADTLESLAVKIKDLGLDPRSLLIESVPATPLVRKMGLRVTGRKRSTN